MTSETINAIKRGRRSVPTRMARVGLAVIVGVTCSAASQYSIAANPAHPNPRAEQDEATVVHRGDVVKLPAPLKHALGELAEEPHTYLPLQVFAEADKASELFQYYLLDTKNF